MLIGKIKLLLNKIPSFEVNRFQFIFLVSIFLVFIENIPSFINKFIVNEYNNYSISNNIVSLAMESFVAFSLLLAVLFIFSINKYLLKLAVIIFLCVSSIFIYILVSYKVFIDEVLILNLIQANPKEVSETPILIPVIIFIVLGVLPSLFVAFMIKIKSSSFKSFANIAYWENLFKQVSYFICIPIILLLMLVLFINKIFFFNTDNIKTSLSSYMPLNYAGAYFQYATKINQSLKFAKNRQYLYKKYNFSFNSNLKNKPLTIVLVVGESSRAKEQAYNGYYKDTNKYTKNIKGLVYLKDVKSCATYTLASVPCMLSYKNRKDFSLPIAETSLISVFRNLGFKTYWISTQSAYIKGDNAIFSVASEAKELYFGNSVRPFVPSGEQVYDGDTLNSLVKKAINSKEKQKFIVFQLHGSHIAYNNRFPKSFAVYKPTCKFRADNCANSNIALQNDYDNTVLYSDYVLSKLINSLKDQNTLLIYASDHGESLPADHSGFLMHAAPYNIAPEEQKHVTSLIWLSEGMQRLLPNALANIKQYSGLHLSHDYIFSTLLGCIGVKSTVINNNLNLCKLSGLSDAKKGAYY